MKRLLALFVAAALVIGAVLVRRALDDEGGSNGNGGNGGGDGVVTLACARELEQVCEDVEGLDDVEILVQDAATTATTLGGTDHGIDGWLTFAPWPEVASVQAGRTVTGDERVVASTRLAIVIWKERRVILESTASCRDGISWRCLGDVSGQSYEALGGPSGLGTVKVGHRPPRSGEGLLVLGNAVASFFEGRTDIGTNDFNTDEFLSWIGRLEREVNERDPYVRMLQQGPGAYTAVGTTEAYAHHSAGARFDQLDFLYPEPMARVPVVLVAVAGGDRVILDLAGAGELREALVREGFQSANDEPPELTGVPVAGALVALSRL